MTSIRLEAGASRPQEEMHSRKPNQTRSYRLASVAAKAAGAAAVIAAALMTVLSLVDSRNSFRLSFNNNARMGDGMGVEAGQGVAKVAGVRVGFGGEVAVEAGVGEMARVGLGMGVPEGGMAEVKAGDGAEAASASFSRRALSHSSWREAHGPLDGGTGAAGSETVSALPRVTAATTTSRKVAPVEKAMDAEFSTVSAGEAVVEAVGGGRAAGEAVLGEGKGDIWEREAWLREPFLSSLSEALKELGPSDYDIWGSVGEEADAEVRPLGWLRGLGEGQRLMREEEEGEEVESEDDGEDDGEDEGEGESEDEPVSHAKKFSSRQRCFRDLDGYNRCHANIFFFGISKCGE